MNADRIAASQAQANRRNTPSQKLLRDQSDDQQVFHDQCPKLKVPNLSSESIGETCERQSEIIERSELGRFDGKPRSLRAIVAWTCKIKVLSGAHSEFESTCETIERQLVAKAILRAAVRLIRAKKVGLRATINTTVAAKFPVVWRYAR